MRIPGRLAPPFGRLRLSLELLCLEMGESSVMRRGRDRLWSASDITTWREPEKGTRVIGSAPRCSLLHGERCAELAVEEGLRLGSGLSMP